MGRFKMNKILERFFLYMVKYDFALKSALYCTNAYCIEKNIYFCVESEIYCTMKYGELIKERRAVLGLTQRSDK